jgi:hypothetical protein
MQRRPSSLTRRKQLVFGLVCLAISATFTFTAAELLVRLKGVEPWMGEDIQLHVTPGGRLYTAHPLLGYAHLPGAFTVSLPNGYAFTVTHRANTLRVTTRWRRMPMHAPNQKSGFSAARLHMAGPYRIRRPIPGSSRNAGLSMRW